MLRRSSLFSWDTGGTLAAASTSMRFLVLLPIAICGCDPMTAAALRGDMSFFRAKVQGQIVAQSPAGGAQVIAFDDCMSGEGEGFFGVELVSSNAPAVLRVAQDPIEGTRARLARPGATGTLASCTQAVINKTGTQISRTTLLEGKVIVDCRGDDGTTYSGTIAFSSCHSSPHAVEVMAALGVAGMGASAELAAAVPLPEVVDLPRLPLPVSELSVRPHVRVVEAIGSSDSGARECLEQARTFMHGMGWRVVDDDSADLEVEMGCTGHVTLIETAHTLGIVLPPADGPSITLRAGGQVIDTVAAGPRALRCDMPSSADRTRQCAARARAWKEAQVEGALASSQPLAAFAKSRHP